MSALSNYLENALLNQVLRSTAYTPGPVYAALFTDGGGLEANSEFGAFEVSTNGTAYARTAIDFGSPASAGSISNTIECIFPSATADWGDLTHMAIMDSDIEGENGNVLFWGELSTIRTVNSGDAFKFAVGDIIISLS